MVKLISSKLFQAHARCVCTLIVFGGFRDAASTTPVLSLTILLLGLGNNNYSREIIQC